MKKVPLVVGIVLVITLGWVNYTTTEALPLEQTSVETPVPAELEPPIVPAPQEAAQPRTLSRQIVRADVTPTTAEPPAEPVLLPIVEPEPELTLCPRDGTVYVVGSCTIQPGTMPGDPSWTEAKVCTGDNHESPADFPCDYDPRMWLCETTHYSTCHPTGSWLCEISHMKEPPPPDEYGTPSYRCEPCVAGYVEDAGGYFLYWHSDTEGGYTDGSTTFSFGEIEGCSGSYVECFNYSAPPPHRVEPGALPQCPWIFDYTRVPAPEVP